MINARLVQLLFVFLVLVFGPPFLISDDPKERVEAIFALSNVALGVFALFGSSISDWIFYKPRVEIALSNSGAGIVSKTTTQGPVRYFHLLIRNKNRNVSVRNLGVFLTGIEIPSEDGSFSRTEFPPVRMLWPFEKHGNIPAKQDLQTELYCDLCHQELVSKRYGYSLELTPLSIEPVFQNEKKLRLSLEIRADNYSSPEPIVVEVDAGERGGPDASSTSSFMKVKLV